MAHKSGRKRAGSGAGAGGRKSPGPAAGARAGDERAARPEAESYELDVLGAAFAELVAAHEDLLLSSAERVALKDSEVAEAAERLAARPKSFASMRELLEMFIENVPAAIAMFDRDMHYIAHSNRWRRDYGLEQELVGRAHYEVFPHLGERHRPHHERALAGEVVRADEDHFIRADGREEWLRWEMRPWQAAGGEVGGIVIFSELITERKELEDQLRRFADYDALTGLLRREPFIEKVENRLAARRGGESEVALLFVDLDRFKEVNDRFGHGAGDRVLKEVAARLDRQLRAGDIAGRYGGDEFLALVRLGPDDDEAELARRFEDNLAYDIEGPDGGRITGRVSVGCVFAGSGETFPALTERADRAMYRSKHAKTAEGD